MDPTAPKDTPVTDETAPPVEAVKKKRKSLAREYVEAIVIAILLALVIRTFVVQAFTIPSGSMVPTLQVGDYILVNKFLYGAEIPFTNLGLPAIRHPRRGDIMVFKYPWDEKRDFIKRVIGLPGEEVYIKGRTVYVNGTPQNEPYAVYNDATPHAGTEYGPSVVPPDSYFMMGDNRDNSQDSRYWGFLKRDKIRGKAFIIYWSWDGDGHWLRWRRLGCYFDGGGNIACPLGARP
ncbi:MAG: signal peptidase I [Candidatus Rokubacteria bacterium]|nr:signal peptidase I [Candidatus Rokubacteria bacterium]MBI2553119.1 signal peptidase I [Candidatus Rokubacteria bacterium]